MTGELPKGWAWTTCDEAGEVSLGRQRSPKYHTGPNMRPYLRVANVFEDRIDTSDVMEMHFAPEEFEQYKLRDGDVLLNEGQSPHLLGRPAIYRGIPAETAYTNSLIRFRARPGIDPRWALTVFRHHMHSGRFARESRITTNIAHLSSKRFAAVEFPVPPTAEQQRIVAELERRLSHLNAATESMTRSRDLLRAARRAVLESAIGHGDGIHEVAAEESLAYLDTLRAERDGEEVQLVGQTERGWPIVSLGSLLRGIQGGKSFACEGRPAQPEEWGVIKVSAMSWGRFLDDENKALPPSAAPRPEHEIRAGDLLISRANTEQLVGASVLVGACRPRLVLSDKSLRLDTLPSVHKPWLHAALSSPGVRAQLSALATGTKESMRNVSQPKIRSVVFPLPPLAVQKAISDEVDRRMSLIDAARRSLDLSSSKAQQLRRALLAAAFSGELVPQDPDDEPADVLLERTSTERMAEAPKKKTRTKNKETVA